MSESEHGGHPNGSGYRAPVGLRDTLGQRSVVITAHVDPDPDALGSALGLTNVLSREGWEATPVCVGTLPSFAPALPGWESIVPYPARVEDAVHHPLILKPGDVLVVMDTPSAGRMAAFHDLHEEVLRECQVLVFDHHYTNTQFGTVNYVDPTAAATAEVVCDVLDAEGIHIDAPAAACFMTALLADTQGFRTESTSARSLLRAYKLAAAGAPIFPLAQLLFSTRPVSGLKLWGAALQHMQAEDSYLWTAVTQEMLREYNSTLEEAEGLVDFLLATRGTRLAMVLKEEPSGETKVSLRTVPGVDATQIAGAFGGGGHQRAAGCTVLAPPDAAAKLILPLIVRELTPSACR